MKKIKRNKKAFLGSVFSAIGNVVNARNQADLQQQQYEYQQGEIFRQQEMQKANILTQDANNQQYVEQMKNRISFGMGGKKRIKKKKAFLGIANAIGDSIGGAINMIGAIANKPKDYTLKYSDPIVAQQAKVIKDPNAPIQPIVPQQPQMINQNPILAQAKLGCKRIKKRNTNRFK